MWLKVTPRAQTVDLKGKKHYSQALKTNQGTMVGVCLDRCQKCTSDSILLFSIFECTEKLCVLSHFSHIWLFCDPIDCSPPGSSVHGILQARIQEWVTMPFSRGSSQPRDWTQVSCFAGRFFTIWGPRETSIPVPLSYVGCTWAR